ncbi:MAG: hypothetical protein U0165_13225 [Polyangiaceae bacterium]
MASRLRTLLGAARAVLPELYSELDAMLGIDLCASATRERSVKQKRTSASKSDAVAA